MGTHGQNVNRACIRRMNARLARSYYERERRRAIEESAKPLPRTVGTPRKPGFFRRIMLKLRRVLGTR